MELISVEKPYIYHNLIIKKGAYRNKQRNRDKPGGVGCHFEELLLILSSYQSKGGESFGVGLILLHYANQKISSWLEDSHEMPCSSFTALLR